MIGSDKLKTLPAGLDTMVGMYELRWGELMAGSTLIALPLLVTFMFLNRYFFSGLAAGALKG
jgi:ABC-type glycerol-3-phosphate transport system permease component